MDPLQHQQLHDDPYAGVPIIKLTSADFQLQEQQLSMTPGRRVDLANLVDRMRIAQLNEQKLQPKVVQQTPPQSREQSVQLDKHPILRDDHHHHFHMHLAPPGAEDKDEIKASSGSDTDSSTEEKHHHRFRLSRHGSHSYHFSKSSVTSRTSNVSGTSSNKKRAILFPKMLNKESVRKAIAMRRAVCAFQEAYRAECLARTEIELPIMAVTGTAIPALWLRRDDKGRRPLEYGDVKWFIRRSLYEFYKLHLTLSAKRFEAVPKFPGQLSSYAFSMAKAVWGMKNEERAEYLRQSNLNRRKMLQEYMCELLQRIGFNSAYDLYGFLEISALSVTKGMGWKGKEGYIHVRITNRSRGLLGMISRWEKRWVILRDSYVVFTPTVGSNEPVDVFMFDQTFVVHKPERTLGMKSHRLQFGNSTRQVEIKGGHHREMVEWMYDFEKIRYYSNWVNSHRFGSFAPERDDAKVKMYVDGKDYFHAISDAIIAAKREIYICDWWLSPELYLRRPPEQNEEFRLDRLLKRKASEGVMIHIVVYKEVSLALTLDSAHTKIWLQDLHPNIQVQRHPDHKICVIDCSLAFIGGLDPCFGRYDTRTHQLSDYHPSGKGTIWPGQDYNNPRIKDFVNVKDYNTDLIEKKLLARMPWHDVSLAVAGQPARDIARHFVQRWNFVKREKGMKKNFMKFLTPKGEFVHTRKEPGWTGSQKVQILRSSSHWSQGIETECSIQDAYIASILKAKHFIYIENQFFITLAYEGGSPDVKNRIGIAIVERILRAHREGTNFRVIVVMPLMPAFEVDIMSSEAGTLRKVMHFQYQSICRGGHSIIERLLAHGIDPPQYIGFFGLRSFDRIKHGKFDSIVEAVKEAEAEDRATIGSGLATSNSRNELNKKDSRGSTYNLANKISKVSSGLLTTNNCRQTHRPDAPEGLAPKGKSLASKFLLEELPKGHETDRIKAVSEKRRPYDARRTWDESISKRAMNPAKEELGYVPASTNEAMEDEEKNAQIARETREAEIEAINNGCRQTGRSSPEFLDGIGTAVRNTIENLKGTKENGDIEPLHRRLRDKGLDNIHHHGSKDGGPGLRQAIENAFRGYDDEISEILGAENEAESIVEPGGSHHHDSSFAEEDGDDDDEKSSSVVGEESISSSGVGSSSAGTGNIPATTTTHGRRRRHRKSSAGPVMDDEVDDFVTEQLYIHSKLMIVDDRIVICGSANLNDRSQMGNRDSEIAIYIEDTEMVNSTMNGKPYLAGKLAHKLRKDIFKEHLGLLPHVEHDVVTKASVLPVDLDAPDKDPEEMRAELIRKANETLHQDLQQEQQQPHLGNNCQPETSMANGEIHNLAKDDEMGADNPSAADLVVRDPLHDDFYECWWKRVAATNTEIFREVFRCVPDDTVQTWDQYKAFVPNPKKVLAGHVAMEGATAEKVKERLKKVAGHLVEFPLRFLYGENLVGTAENAVVPMEIFT
ncbi:hypothetical protein BGX26_010701 [Mortierella sp. AD094]|nr:hypothetical protein BGX26_010701 [Mortierella sp. AD094]